MSRSPLTSVGAHRLGDPDRGAEEIGQDRNCVTDRLFEKECRPALTKGEVTDRCHFKPRGDWLCDSHQVAFGLQRPQEMAQIRIFHTKSL